MIDDSSHTVLRTQWPPRPPTSRPAIARFPPREPFLTALPQRRLHILDTGMLRTSCITSVTLAVCSRPPVDYRAYAAVRRDDWLVAPTL